jgi:hypothetical protein
MKYEEWIKYEQVRQNQSDLFAWISYADPPIRKRTNFNPSAHTAQIAPHRKKTIWLNITQRFLSRRI